MWPQICECDLSSTAASDQALYRVNLAGQVFLGRHDPVSICGSSCPVGSRLAARIPRLACNHTGLKMTWLDFERLNFFIKKIY